LRDDLSEMRAVTLESFDRPPALREDLPTPQAGEHEVVVRVHASSVNPADAAIAAGLLAGMFEHEFPVILGRDFAGVVEHAGPGVMRYGLGDWVYGFLMHADPTVKRGSWAEQVTVREDRVAAKPDGIDLVAAGAAPLAGIAAIMALDALALAPGNTLLVVGATGGVGSLAVQLAHAAGVHVIAPALPEDDVYLSGLGVTEIVPREGDVAAAVRERHPDGVDAVLDLLSFAPDHAGLLGEGGRLASPLGAAGEGPGRVNVIASPDPQMLARLGGLLDEGALRVPIQRVYGFEEAGEALAALGAEHTQGKLALTIG
jgi:NADPH:quinone reductase-like Zn-dependent oxidoreductase